MQKYRYTITPENYLAIEHEDGWESWIPLQNQCHYRSETKGFSIEEIRALVYVAPESEGSYVMIFDGSEEHTSKRVHVTPQGFYRDGQSVPDVTILEYFLKYPDVGFSLP